MGRRSWVVQVKNCKKDIKKCIIIGLENDNGVCGVIKYKNTYHLLFVGDGNCTKDGFVGAGYSVQLLDEMNQNNGKIKNAKYITETDSIDCVLNYEDIDKIVTTWYSENRSDLSDESSDSDDKKEKLITDPKQNFESLEERVKLLCKRAGLKYDEMGESLEDKLNNAEKNLEKLEKERN